MRSSLSLFYSKKTTCKIIVEQGLLEVKRAEITNDILTGRARKAGHACYDETKQY